MGTTYRELFKLYDLIQSGDAGCVERFLRETSADLNIILPCKGIGVLHLAVGIEPQEKSRKCTELILKHGGDPNLSNDEGITPVHIAAIWGKVDNLKLLIGCGGDPCRQDLDGISAFDYAVREEQWDVYDYLHNVIDQSDDSIESECAYTLDLERILVTTDQMVAEYEVVNENQNNTSVRKSEMIKDWCDKNSLVINKLYPTILGETYLVDDDWKSNDKPKNSDNLNDTITTFKTCVSHKDSIDISGLCRLDQTINNSGLPPPQQTDKNSKRSSIYENFSLPGSPNSIIHRNYNTKSSLKKNKNLSNEMSKLTLNTKVDLDKALAVVQNRTNEWLSSCSDETCDKGNTRRSSASSGVSSNFSGSVLLASVQEEYKYEDKEEDVVLIERRLRVSSVILPLEESESPDETILSLASSLPPTMEYDAQSLRAELIELGCNPGPISDSTKHLYLKKLQNLKKQPVVVQSNKKTYTTEIQKSFQTEAWMDNLSPYVELHEEIKADFSEKKCWREGGSKTSFTYLLLDPRRTSRLLPCKGPPPARLRSWQTFVDSIFYVGKGKRSRPYAHLYQALNLWKKDFKTSRDEKVQTILDIWSAKLGVVCLHVFQNVIPAEAYTNEAAMIDAIGIQNLKNIKIGNYYGVAKTWSANKHRMLGLNFFYFFFSHGFFRI
ncbi:unnamed protein product, partial [Brenthis ino]